MMNIVGSSSPETRFRSQSGSPASYTINNKQAGPGPDPFMDLLFLGWNSDLPDPATLSH